MSSEDLFKLGGTLKDVRKELRLTLQQLADKTALSRGLLSKIENSRTVPSLPVLMRICKALDTSLSQVLYQMESFSTRPYILVRSHERTTVQRENVEGYHYETILSHSIQDGFFESTILTVTGNATGELITTDGDMFVYALSGTIILAFEDEDVELKEGDAIFFDGNRPHITRHKGKGKGIVMVNYMIRSVKS